MASKKKFIYLAFLTVCLATGSCASIKNLFNSKVKEQEKELSTRPETLEMLRLDKDGKQLDQSFGEQGMIKFDRSVRPRDKTEFLETGVLSHKGKRIIAQIGKAIFAFDTNGQNGKKLAQPESDADLRLVNDQPNADIIIAGVSGEKHLRLERLVPAGTKDAKFGEGGFFGTDLSVSGGLDRAAVILRKDGRILLWGRSDTGEPSMRRLTTDGKSDKPFGKDGSLSDPDGNKEEGPYRIMVYPDHRFILVDGTKEIRLRRFLADGKPDAGFGENGVLQTKLEADADGGNLVAATAKGLFVGGRMGDQYLLTGYDANGKANAKFNKGEPVTISGVADKGPINGSTPSLSLFVGAGDKIIVMTRDGCADNCTHLNGVDLVSALRRFNGDGSVDKNFGNGGLVTIKGLINTVLIQEDQRIVVGGHLVALQ